MLTVVFNNQPGHKALYIQLYEGIKQMIIDGTIAPGEKLPSKKKLATHLKVSVKTVENAYFQLTLEGYIYSKEKVGYFASNLDGFRKSSSIPKPAYINRYKETVYKLDVKANKTPLELFPLSVWNRLGREVMSEQGEHLLETVPFNGVPELRIAIAQHLREFRGMKVSPDQIIIGSGTEYLYRRIVSLLGQDSTVGMEDPGYSHIWKILSTCGTPLRAIAMDDDGICVPELEKVDCTAVHISPMHHFPLGVTMPVQRRVDLLTWANKESGRFIIEDDYNCEFLYQGSPVPPLFSLDLQQKVIYLNTFSKTVAPGIRIAYLVLPEKLMDRYLKDMSFYSCTVPSSVQYQLAKFISGGHFERYIHRVRQHNTEQRKLVLGSIAASNLSDKVTALRNPAGTHFLLKLATEKSDAYIKERLLEQGILTSFVTEYCTTARAELQHLLILNYSRVTEDDMSMLLRILEDAI